MNVADELGELVSTAGGGGSSPFRMATVTASPIFGGVQIQFAYDAANEAAPPLIGGVPYNISGYASPAVGDVVLVAMVGGTSPFVLCKSSQSP